MTRDEKLDSFDAIKEFVSLSGNKRQYIIEELKCEVWINKLNHPTHYFADKIEIQLDEFNAIYYITYNYLKSFKIETTISSNKHLFLLNGRSLELSINDFTIKFRV